MPSKNDPVTRRRTRSQARAETDVASLAEDPAPAPVVKSTKPRAARTKSTPTISVIDTLPAPTRRAPRSSAVSEKPKEGPSAAVARKEPTQDKLKKFDKLKDRLLERATSAAALANGQTPPPRSRTLSMANAARGVRFRTPTPPSDVPQSVPAPMPSSQALQDGSTETGGSSGSGTLDISDLGSTSMATGATLRLMKEVLMKEIGNNIEQGDEVYATELYRDMVSDAKIKASFKAVGYDPKAQYRKDGIGRWTALPTEPTSEAAIQKPMTALVTTILAKLAPKDKRNTRRVEDTSATLLQHRDDVEHTTKPDISIVATGPSFELPYAHAVGASTTIGFSNLATAFELRLDKSKGGHKTNIEQVGIYARQIFIQQPNRKFVRALMITEHHVRLLHFDRSGVKYSPFINIHRDPFTFVRLILGLSSPKEEVLGLDTNIQWKVERGRKISGTIKMVDSNQESVTFDLIDVHPVFHRAALRGRGTTCWHARDRNGNPLDGVLIKDAWRGEDRASEHAMLEKVKGVNGVAQMLYYCESLAETKDFRGSQVPDRPNFLNRVWVRLVLKQYGRALKHFTSQRQAIGALRDTLAAHSRLIEHKSVLHRDISMRNILLGLPDAPPGRRGILVDFDMAIHAQDDSSISVDCRTGTRMYQSLSILWSYEPTSNATAHDYLDDMESFFLVLAHLMLGWSGIEQEIKPRPDTLIDWDNEVPRIGRTSKNLFIYLPLDAGEIPAFWSDPCRDLLEAFRAFLQAIVQEKERIRRTANPELRLKRLQKLHAQRKAHYDTVKAMFDKALDEIERYGEKPSTRVSGDTEWEDESSGSSPTSLARISKRGSDDVEETPSKRNRTAEYNGTRLSHAVNEDDETSDD